MTLLITSFEERCRVWKQVFEAAGEPILINEAPDPAEVTHIACWVPPEDLSVYPNLKVMISVGAGVDQMPIMPEGVVLSRTLAQSVDTMVRNWCVMATLMLSRDMPTYLVQAGRGEWQTQPIAAAEGIRVGVLGMGRIGQIVAESLSSLGYSVAGWSRSGRPVAGIDVYDAAGLDAFLGRSDVLICLLPLTPETAGLMDAAFLARLPRGARLVQAGRGAQLDLDALHAALEAGQLASAMLDVTDPEPLPADHWAWSDPRVIITPHVAGQTDNEEGANHALDVIRAGRVGRPIPGLVDQSKGY